MNDDGLHGLADRLLEATNELVDVGHEFVDVILRLQAVYDDLDRAAYETEEVPA